MEGERSKITCKGCGLEKERIQDGSYDGINKRWRDDKGVAFNGRLCPDCHRLKTKLNMQNKRKNVHSG